MPSVRLSTGLFIVAVAACTEAAPSTSSSSSELTAEQCMYFQDGGRTTVCHATGSARNDRPDHGRHRRLPQRPRRPRR